MPTSDRRFPDVAASLNGASRQVRVTFKAGAVTLDITTEAKLGRALDGFESDRDEVLANEVSAPVKERATAAGPNFFPRIYCGYSFSVDDSVSNNFHFPKDHHAV